MVSSSVTAPRPNGSGSTSEKLVISSIPNLQPPCLSNVNINTPLPPPASSSSTVNTPWYRHKQYEDEDDEEIYSKNQELSSSADINFEASTPVTNRTKSTAPSSESSNISMSFMSPISKLDNLHLESEIDLNQEKYYDDDQFSLGDKTITNETESDIEYSDDNKSRIDLVCSSPPIYINQRKRQIESPDLKTPNSSNYRTRSRHFPGQKHSSNDISNDNDQHMSICTSNLSSIHKLSFSNSDSTPCPVQPKRKRLKFKHSNENTPTNGNQKTHRLLKLSSSVKTDVSSIMSQLNDHQQTNDEDDDELSSSSPPSAFSNAPLQSTPISQSTPANSRSSTPPATNTSEFGNVNGFKFVKPAGKPTPQYSFQTPVNRTVVEELKSSYARNDFSPLNGGKYEIMGEFPVTSAGLMDESSEDIHIGDKRINDPYLKQPTPTASEKPDSSRPSFNYLREQYLNSSKLPLLSDYENQESLSPDQLLNLVGNKHNVYQFYTNILVSGEELLSLLKNERIRWHPDKWAAKLRTNTLHFNIKVLDRLSQVLNEIIEEQHKT